MNPRIEGGSSFAAPIADPEGRDPFPHQDVQQRWQAEPSGPVSIGPEDPITRPRNSGGAVGKRVPMHRIELVLLPVDVPIVGEEGCRRGYDRRMIMLVEVVPVPLGSTHALELLFVEEVVSQRPVALLGLEETCPGMSVER